MNANDLYDEIVLDIAIPAPVVDAAFERAYAEIRTQLKIPGFARGEAPLDVVRTMMAGRVHADVALPLLAEEIPKALAAAGYDPSTSVLPAFDSDLLAPGRSFDVRATFWSPKPRSVDELFAEIAEDFAVDRAERLADVCVLTHAHVVARADAASSLSSMVVAKVKAVARTLAKDAVGATSSVQIEAFGLEVAARICSRARLLAPDDEELASLAKDCAARYAKIARA